MSKPFFLNRRNISQLTGMVVSLAALGAPAYGQDFKNSIVSTDFDFIMEDDPSTFSALRFEEKREAELPDKRREDAPLFKDAYVFNALFSDNTEVSILVDVAIGSEEAARAEVMRYVHPIGKLPTALRHGVDRLCIHSGGEKTTAFSDIGLIVVYADNATVRIANHDLEETIFHESVHAAWDQQHAKSDGWVKAQTSDGAFATDYGRANPELEDLAETALFAYTMVHHPDRLPGPVRETLQSTIPARIDYVAQLLPPDKPIHFPVAPALSESHSANRDPATPCDVTHMGYAADIISHCLLTDFALDETAVRKLLVGTDARYESGEEVFQAVIQAFKLDSSKLKSSVIKNLHENCNHVSDFDDSAIREAVEAWQSKN